MDGRPDGTETISYGIPSPGFRLDAGTRIGRVRLQVADLGRSLAYYEGVLGFRVLERSGKRVSLGEEGTDVPLIELHEKPGSAPVPPRGRLGLFHYAILLPDRAALGALLRQLTELGQRPGTSNHLVSEALYLQDPDGLGIEVYADRPRAEWRHRDRQLVMATQPLDIAGVVRAAGSASWSGMPAGTTIGHVHLHVGDLDRAAAFYHEALGLDKVVWSYPGALFLSAGGYHHHLGLNTWAASAPAAGEGDARLLDWELLVPSPDDVEGAIASMQAAGYPVERGAGGAVLRDPWGTALRIRAADAR
ncbi:MAG TPA: VOC family protein [Longimicrobiales bacterium]|nr:VOC family protein [Longimicrobiales bacterium]